MRVFVSILIVVGLSLANIMNAADYKIAVVDYQQILKDSRQVKEANNKLRNQFKPEQDKIIAKQKELQKEGEKYKKDNLIMKDSDKKKAEEKLYKMSVNLEGMKQEYQKKLVAAQQTAMQKVISLVNAAVSKVAKKGKYNLVLIRDAVPYFEKDADITKEVMAEI